MFLIQMIDQIKNVITFFYLLMIIYLLYLSSFLPKKLNCFWYEKLIVLHFHLILKLLHIRVEVYDDGRMDRKLKAIYISNHPSKIETFLLPTLIPNLDGLVDEESLSIPFLGRIYSKTTSVFINRKSLSSRSNGIFKLKNRIKAERNILLFPEGKPSVEIAKKFHEGAFYLSKKMKVPIVPIYINYSHPEAFKVDKKTTNFQLIYRLLKTSNKFVKIYFSGPINPNDFADVSLYTKALHDYYISLEKKIKTATSLN